MSCLASESCSLGLRSLLKGCGPKYEDGGVCLKLRLRNAGPERVGDGEQLRSSAV